MELAVFVGPIASALLAFAGSYLALSTKIARLETMIENLTVQVEKHNKVVERMYRVEADVENLYHRYDELKGLKIGGTD